MPKSYKTPGVYIEEIPKLPVSIAAVETAIPAFIGYTQKAKKNTPGDLDFIPIRIISLLEYEEYFGTMNDEAITINIADELTIAGTITLTSRNITVHITPSKNITYYQLQIFFANGGDACYIVSTGRPKLRLSKTALKKGLNKLRNYDEPTLIIFPEGCNLSKAKYLYDIYNETLMQAYNLKDRFVIMDINNNVPGEKTITDFFRDSITGGLHADSLKYGAVYFPMIVTNMPYHYNDSSVNIIHKTFTKNPGKADVKAKGEFDKLTLNNNLVKENIVYASIKAEINKYNVTLPPSAAVAGVYNSVDKNNGVWKAPANISFINVNAPNININSDEQASLNVDVNTGKSINVIRYFTGRDTVIWGARTLAGNDNEWCYISVRRFFNMVEESVQKAMQGFTFEPNESNTWVTVKSIIENFLLLQWRAGALPGAKPEEAFFVHVGLGETMTAQDILDGRMIVQIGMAPVRPAEFIIITITQIMKLN